MRARRHPIVAALLILAAAAAPGAVRLGGPQVVKLAWHTQALVAADIDGDGRTDLALLDNDGARIELLYQRRPGEPLPRERATGRDRWQPVLEDAPFRHQGVATGIRMFDLAVGDLDGDGRADLVYTGNPDGLTVRYQRAPGDFSEHRVLEVDSPSSRPGTLLVEDLDGDGRRDLGVLTDDELLLFTQGEDSELAGPRSYGLPDRGCFGLQASDVDGDGTRDLLYQVADSQDAIRVRLGLGDGGYGPERSFRIDAGRGAMVSLPTPGRDRPCMARVQAATGLLEVVCLQPSPHPARRLGEVQPRLFSTRSDPKTPASYAIADLDRDGRPDIAVADGRGARIWILLQPRSGRFSEAVEYPSLADVRSLGAGDLDGDGRPELVLASPRERTLAWTTLTADGRMDYPHPLPTQGQPYAAAVADLDGDRRPEIVAAYDDRGQRGVEILSRASSDGPWEQRGFALDGFDSPPRGLRILDADQDGLPDLAVFGNHDGMRLLLQAADGSFRDATVAGGLGQGLVNDVDPAALTLGDLDGDGRPEMLVAAQGYARSLRLGADGSLEVLDQYNARSSDTRLAAALTVDLERDGVPEVVLVQKGGGRLEVTARRRGGVYRHLETVPIPAIDVVDARVVDLAGDGAPDLLLLGTDRFVWLPLGGVELEAESLTTHEADLADVTYNLLGVGDLDSDGADDIVAIDNRVTEVLEVLSLDSEQRWRSELHFRVFDVDPHYEGQRGNAAEPRQVVISDLDADGRDDIALLVHDRILVYPQR